MCQGSKCYRNRYSGLSVQAAATRNVEKDSAVKRKPVKTQKTLHKDTTTKSIAADSSLVKESVKPAVTDPDSANEVDGLMNMK
jgi:hypothetical protein